MCVCALRTHVSCVAYARQVCICMCVGLSVFSHVRLCVCVLHVWTFARYCCFYGSIWESTQVPTSLNTTTHTKTHMQVRLIDRE